MSFQRVDADTLARVREFYTEDDDAEGTIKMLLRALEASYAEIDRLTTVTIEGKAEIDGYREVVEVRVGQVRADPDPQMRRFVRVVELGHRAVYGRDAPAALCETVRHESSDGKWVPSFSGMKTRIRIDRLVRWKLVASEEG